MSYRFEPDEYPAHAARRVAREQADKALAELRCDDRSVGWRIHQLRKRCKKLRALARLVRPAFDDYKRTNRGLRDLARVVSDERDMRMMTGRVDSYADHLGLPADPDSPEGPLLQRWMTGATTVAEAAAEQVLSDLERRMAETAADIERWDLGDVDTAALLDGVLKTLRRAHKRYAKTLASPTVGNFHAWRKRSKYHWYHLRLLEKLLPPDSAARVDVFDDLSDELGDAHDQSVLVDYIGTLPGTLRDHEATRQLVALALAKRRRHRADALETGAAVLGGSADDFVGELGRYWRDQPAGMAAVATARA